MLAGDTPVPDVRAAVSAPYRPSETLPGGSGRAAPPGPYAGSYAVERLSVPESAEVLRGRQRSRLERIARWREAWVPRKLGQPTTYTAPPVTVRGGQKMLVACVQWTGSSNYVGDVSTGGVHQHIDAIPNQVLVLAYAVAAYLISTDARWVAQTVVPLTLTFSHNSNGLDAFWAVGGGVYGTNLNGVPYFDGEGVQGEDGGRLLLVAGTPSLTTYNPV